MSSGNEKIGKEMSANIDAANENNMDAAMRKRYELTARAQKHAFLELELPYFVFEIKEQVRPDILCEAARSAVGMHPLFGTSLIQDQVFYLEEDSCWEQHPEGTVIAGGRGKTLWELSCTNNLIIYSGLHALTDGMGVLQFTTTVLHQYFSMCGVQFSKDADSDLPSNPTDTTAHPWTVCPKSPDSFVGVPKFPASSPISDEYFSPEVRHYLHMIEIPENEIRQFATRSETSIFSIIACLLARTVQETFHIDDGCISVRVPVDYRKTFNTNIDSNFSQGFSLCYRPKTMTNMPDEMVETVFRSQLDLFTDRDNMIQTINKDYRRMQDLKEGRVDFDSYYQHAEGADGPTAMILYTHLTRPGFSKELSALINRFVLISNTKVPYSMHVGATSHNGVITLGINQHIVGEKFITTLKQKLKDKGINFRFHDLSMIKIPEKEL